MVLWLHLLHLGQLEYRAGLVPPGTPRRATLVGRSEAITMQGGRLDVAGLSCVRISVTPSLLTDHVTYRPLFRPQFPHLYNKWVDWKIIQVTPSLPVIIEMMVAMVMVVPLAKNSSCARLCTKVI